MPDSVPSDTDLSKFFDLALDLFCIAGTDGYFKHVNPAFSRTLGYTREELLSIPFLELVHEDDRELTRREVQRLASGEDTVKFENRYQCKDGSWRWLEWTCPTSIDKCGLLYAVARDITATKEAQQQLLIRDSIFSSMQNGLLITDARQADNPIIYCNAAFQKLTGYSSDEILGRNCRFLQGHDTNQPQINLLREAIREGKSCRVLLRNYNKQGTLFWNELIISPVRDEDGAVTHFVGLQYDISEIMRANSGRWAEVSQRMEVLPPRQREIMELMVSGSNTKSIAVKLGISPKTVETHRARMFKTMSVDDAVGLVRMVMSSHS